MYRWNFFLRSLFGLFPLLGTVFIWGAIFEAKGGGINNFDYASVVYYFLLVLVLDSLITPGDDEWQVAADIRDGQIQADELPRLPGGSLCQQPPAVHGSDASGRHSRFRCFPTLSGVAVFLGNLDISRDKRVLGGIVAVLDLLFGGDARVLDARDFDSGVHHLFV